MILLPDDWNIYRNSIRDRCHDFIEMGIWNGIDRIQLNLWLQNFQTNEEKYLSACLLDSLIYKSQRQTYSHIFQLLFHAIPNLFRRFPPPTGNTSDFPRCLCDNTDPGIRLVAAVAADDGPTKSAYEIVRFMRRIFRIKDSWIIHPSQIKDAINLDCVNTFIFIDDFLGTGDQFYDYTRLDWNLNYYASNNYLVYAPLTAHNVGLTLLSTKFKELHVTYSEYLDEQHSFFYQHFSDNENQMSDGEKIIAAKEFYKNMFDSRGILIPHSKLFGWGELELSYGFEHGFPDNSLPVYYWADNWHPLFNR